MRITLTVTEGPHTGQSFSFEEHDNFIVGRSKRAHFRLPLKDKFFSRIHFMVEVNPPHCRLMDMGSTNGTHVNGEKVSVADLKDGDTIKAGQTVLTLAVEAGLPSVIPEAILVESAPLDPGALATIPPVPVSTPPPPSPRVTPPQGVSPVPAVPTPVVTPPAPPPKPARPKPKSKAPSPTPAADCCRACEQPAAPPAADLPAAIPLCAACQEKARKQQQTIPGYLIVREIGRGGMGVVYLAVRQSDGLLVAVKTIIPAVAASKAHVERFLREATIIKQLDHPNIVAFREMGEAAGQLFFAMDFIRGTDGAGLVKRNKGPLPIPRAANLVCQLLGALEYAHARKFVHRDIKPANLLVADGDVVKVADFGLARVYQQSHLSGLTMMGDMGGTVAFMPPEQITHYRESKPPVDQYAAGATLYNLLTDKFIYDMPRFVQKQLLKVLQDPPVPIQTRRMDIPDKLSRIVHRAIAREPGDRFGDVRAFREALLPFTKG